MAIRTISATGGNWNSTATWIEGVVPVAGDDIFGVTASGNLTINVQTAQIKSLDLSSYTGTISGSQRILLQSSGTNSAGVSWDVEPNVILGGTWTNTNGGTLGRDYANNASNFGIKMGPTFVTASTNFSLLNFNQLLNSRCKLYSDVWAWRLWFSNNTFVEMGSYSFYVSEQIFGGIVRVNSSNVQIPEPDPINQPTLRIVGNNHRPGVTASRFFCGVLNQHTIEFLTGTYSGLRRGSTADATPTGNFGLHTRATYSNGGTASIRFMPGAYFIKTGTGPWDATNVYPEFALTIAGSGIKEGLLLNQNLLIENQSGNPIPKIYVDDFIGTNAARPVIGTGSSQIITDVVEHIFMSNNGLITNTTATQSQPISWMGTGLSCSTYITTPLRTCAGTEAATTVFNAQSTFASAAPILFTSTATHSIGRFIAINGDRRTQYRSTTTTTPSYPLIGNADGSKATISLGAGGFAYNYSIQNIDFTNATFISIGDGTITNSTGATNSFITGGGGGGPSSLTFLS